MLLGISSMLVCWQQLGRGPHQPEVVHKYIVMRLCRRVCILCHWLLCKGSAGTLRGRHLLAALLLQHRLAPPGNAARASRYAQQCVRSHAALGKQGQQSKVKASSHPSHTEALFAPLGSRRASRALPTRTKQSLQVAPLPRPASLQFAPAAKHT